MLDVASVRVLLTALVSWLNRHQQEAMAYLIEENRILPRLVSVEPEARRALSQPVTIENHADFLR